MEEEEEEGGGGEVWGLYIREKDRRRVCFGGIYVWRGLPNKSNATRTNKRATCVPSQRATTDQRRARLENS
jgi:hypothetical protein